MERELSMLEKKEIKICALVPDPYDTSPSQRFRIEQWEPYLKQEGIIIDYFSFTDENLRNVLYKEGYVGKKAKELLKASFRRLNHIFKAADYDAVFLHRAASMIGPAWMEKMLKWRKIPIIYDFDDSIFLTDTSKANRRFGWAKFSSKTADICRLSTSITVGNSFLADYARKYNERVTVVPTSIDTEKYQPSNNKNGFKERVVIGWTGSSTSQYHLEMFEPVLADLLKERDVEIRVISNREPNFTKFPYVWRNWMPETEVEELLHIDIGIMPTPDDEWSKGKCALKALQYMALGIPAVCSDVGANRDVIRQGENGFLAKSPEDWLVSLKKLIDDADLRRQLGEAARQTIVENYSMKKCAQNFAQVVFEVVKNKNREGNI